MQSTIGQRIRKLRKDQNLSLEAFASSISTSSTNLANIEKDRTKPGFDIIESIIQQYIVDADWLITGRDKPVQILEEPKEDPIQAMASWMAKIERDIYLLQRKLIP